MKKMIKVLLIMFILIFIVNNYAYAGFGFFEGIYGDGDTHMDIDIELGKSGAESSSKQITERILGTLQVIGSVVAVIALIIIGFRYMFSSLEEKAQMKGVLIYYVVGAALVFATSNLLSVVYKVISGI